MESKVNYQVLFEKTLQNLNISDIKPKLLLHVCCGPCFTLPYEILKQYFDITIYFNNSNIFPKEEYFRRLLELKQYIKTRNYDIKIIETKYDNISYNKYLEPYKNEPEGGKRCQMCFLKRLSETFEYGVKNNFDFVSTVMTISRYKNSQIINEIGKTLEEKYRSKTKWLFADFKKKDGYNKSLDIVKEFNLYFQKYCGCKFSIKNIEENSKK